MSTDSHVDIICYWIQQVNIRRNGNQYATARNPLVAPQDKKKTFFKKENTIVALLEATNPTILVRQVKCVVVETRLGNVGNSEYSEGL